MRRDTIGQWIATLVALLGLAIPACTGGGTDVVWETIDGVRFTTRISDEAAMARIEAAFASDGRAGIPNGRLMRGDGGFNEGHDWHMVDVEVVDMAIELCDGTASMVDADVDYWVDTVGQYCPWDARVVAVER